MSQDPGTNYTTKALEKLMRQMVVDGPDEIGGEYEDYVALCRKQNKFPLLALPKRAITNVFSFLGMQDRMRARVSKKLNEIEGESGYYVDKLTIEEGHRTYIISTLSIVPTHHIIFNENDPRSCDAIRRIFKSASIGSLNVILNTEGNVCRNIRNLIKESKNIGYLAFRFDFHTEAEELVVATENFLIDIAESCKGMDLVQSKYISVNSLHEVYKKMVEGSTKFRKFECSQFSNYACEGFLSLIGIRCKYGRVFSDRGIEAFKHGETSYCIFDGNLEISFYLSPHIDDGGYSGEESDPGSYWGQFGTFLLKSHQTKESIDRAKAKRGWVRVGIYPIRSYDRYVQIMMSLLGNLPTQDVEDDDDDVYDDSD